MDDEALDELDLVVPGRVVFVRLALQRLALVGNLLVFSAFVKSEVANPA